MFTQMITPDRHVSAVATPRTRFFLRMSIALGVAVLWGFGPTYFLRPWIATRDLSFPVHVHAMVFIAWIALLILQTALVASRRTDLHRRVGSAGIVLAAAVVIAGVTIAILAPANPRSLQAWRSIDGLTALLRFLIRSNAISPIVFGLFATAGIMYRRRPEIHKRLMLFASLAISNAAVARVMDDVGWPIVPGPFGFAAPTALARTPLLIAVCLSLFVAAVALHDVRTLRRVHPVTIIGGLAVTPVGGLLLLVASWLHRKRSPLAFPPTVDRSEHSWH
jgi:hypothetical protein